MGDLRCGGEAVQKEIRKFFPCFVAVSSFHPNSQVDVSISGALWWMHNGWGNSTGSTKLTLGSFPLTLRNFNMTSDTLTFGFSGAIETSSSLFSDLDVMSDSDGQGIVAPTFILSSYICKIDDDAYINALGDSFVVVGFTFDGSVWYNVSDEKTKIEWPG